MSDNPLETVNDWLSIAPDEWDFDYKMMWAKYNALQSEKFKLVLENRKLNTRPDKAELIAEIEKMTIQERAGNAVLWLTESEKAINKTIDDVIKLLRG